MRLLKTAFLVLISIFAFSSQIQAQSCIDLYKRANALRDSKNYEDAIAYYQRAKNCDPNLKADCDKWIKYCRNVLGSVKRKTVLEVSSQEIRIPYQGGDKQIEVKSTGKWKIDGTTDWCSTEAYNSKNFIVQCREVNNSISEKVTTLMVKSGSQYKPVRVIQEGRPEYIELGANSLSFPAKGTEDDITIESNVDWKVTSAPSWCRIDKRKDGIHIIVSPNDRVIERTDEIIIVSPSKSVSVKIYQSAGDEHLTLSQNNLVLNSEGDMHYVKVYTDADNWFVGDYPTWMNVERVGQDSICIKCGSNIPNGEPRSGSVQVRTDRQTAGVLVTQSPRMPQDLIFPDSKLVGGRNFALGFSASYYMPFINTSAGGFVGSVVDYGAGESASYKSAVGYSFGVFADIRLYKNIFLMAGVNFTQIKYKNEFNGNTIAILDYKVGDRYKKGEVQNSYTEDYTHTMIEVPVLASYRFKVNNVSHVQLNVGPVLNFGLSAKMKLSGNTDGYDLHFYNSNTGQIASSVGFEHHTAVNSEFDLYKPSVSWDEVFTDGNDFIETHKVHFQESPLKKFNCGLRIGAAYEWAGLSFGISYTHMLTNMANKNYWENDRFTVLNQSENTMKGYKHRINTLEFKLAYTLRYLKF